MVSVSNHERIFSHTLRIDSAKPIDRCALCHGLIMGRVGYRGAAFDPFYFLTSYPQLFVDLREKNERCHNEIGAPDYRIGIPCGIVLTPWDQNLFPVFGPVATAQEDSWRLERVKSRPVSAFGCCGFT